jgi:Ca2+-dependent lipid-binding protein
MTFYGSPQANPASPSHPERLKLMSNFPHVQMVHMSFMEKPSFDYVLKPLGGEKFGMDVNSIPGLSGYIKDQVHAK